jgi:hypothetical protein
MRRQLGHIFLAGALVIGLAGTAMARTAPPDPSRVRGPIRTAIASPNIQNRVHDAGKMWMNITNYGYFGNAGPEQSDALANPCPPGNWAPQCEYPGGSDQQYLYQAALWVGALIDEEGFQTKRVSVGTDGWFNPAINEMYPGEGVNDGIIERSIRPGYSNCLGEPVTDPDAVSDQDFIATYTDTLRESFWVVDDPVDGPHRPLGIKITQTSYSFTQAFAEDFILIDYEFENIASNFLKNVYVGLYVDSDVGPGHQFEHHTDDICGFLKNYYLYYQDGSIQDSVPIDVAWIADNDGRPPNVSTPPFDCPNVTGTRVIRGPNPRLKTSFNWWISNGDVSLDFGPAWEAYCSRDSNGLGWTSLYGTPVGDEHKYQVLSNSEFDYDQIMVDRPTEVQPQQVTLPNGQIAFKPWGTACDPAENQSDIANGFDTRYLLSWGPLGVYEYTDNAGNRIYRLNPGEKFKMTIAYVGGQNFHDPNHPQPTPEHIDSSLFNFADLRENARWAKDVYDNRMFDTPQYDWGNDHDPNTYDDDGSQGDGKLDSGDGWYGEDVGADGLYIEPPVGFVPGRDSVAVYYFKDEHGNGIFAGYYKGPDAGERDGHITNVSNPLHTDWATEDWIVPDELIYTPPRVPERLGYWDMGWMHRNGQLDLGDGIPDFTGPPPPPIPALLHCIPGTMNSAANFGGQIRGGCWTGGIGYVLEENDVILRWSKKSSQDTNYVDPFSRVQDFEGYRIHVGNINQEGSYSLLAQYDRCDFAYFSDNDSMMTLPVPGLEDTLGPNYSCVAPAGMSADTVILDVPGHLRPVGLNTGLRDLILDDSTYQYVIPAHKLAPRYYSVTAFDFGDPKAGLGPLTTRPTANAVLLAPAGDPRQPVRVVPNPYRAYADYTQPKLGISWENQNDGTREFFAQQDRRIEFINLPHSCLIRIYTVAGDLVQIVPHNIDGDFSSWASETSERWDLNSRNNQQVVSGIYLFSVEDRSEGSKHEIQTGKFVIIR